MWFHRLSDTLFDHFEHYGFDWNEVKKLIIITFIIPESAAKLLQPMLLFCQGYAHVTATNT